MDALRDDSESWEDLYDPDFVEAIKALCAENIAFAGLEQAIMEGTYEALLATFTGATKEEVLAAAQASAARLVTGVSEQVMAQMADKIAAALEAQTGHIKLARELKEGLGLDSNREKSLAKFKAQLEKDGVTGEAYDKAVEKERRRLIDERSKVIAQTEMGRALEEGALAEAHGRGDTHKVWIAVGDYDDECLANEAQGPVAIGDPFGTGDQAPPAHPRCRCSLGYVKNEGKGELDRAKARAEERAKRHADERAQKETTA